MKLNHIMCIGMLFLYGGLHANEKTQICATTPSLKAIAEAIGGERVNVTSFAKATDDIHKIVARPRFYKMLNEADLLLLVGLELETGWLPTLIRQARNPKVKTGSPGYLDCSQAITALEKPTGPIDRSMGDVHAGGNPHYLVDPVNGIKVARLIAGRLSELDPEGKTHYEKNLARFTKTIATKLIGAELAEKYPIVKLMRLQDHQRLMPFLKSQGEADKLGGWLKSFAALENKKVIEGHKIWIYMIRRYGLESVGSLEPKPGISPTMSSLRKTLLEIKEKDVACLLYSPVFKKKHVEFITANSTASGSLLSHEVNACDEGNDYVQMLSYNAESLLKACRKEKKAE